MTSSNSSSSTKSTGSFLTATDGQTVGFNAFQIREIGKYDVATCAAGFGGAQVQLPGSTVVNVCYTSAPTQMPPNTGPVNPMPTPSPMPSPSPMPTPNTGGGSSGTTNPRSPWSPFGPSSVPSTSSGTGEAGRTNLAGSSSYSSSSFRESDHGRYSDSGYRSTDHNLKNFHGYYDQYRNGHFRPPY